MISENSASRLRAHFRGALLRPKEEGYDEARQVWNGAIDRKPAIVARCAGADDVALAVKFAREHDMPLTVRGGGHAVAGYAVADDALMIDLSLMKGIHVDPAGQTVRASGGVLLGELDRATQRFGLAVPSGIVSHTGVGGLTLGGGLGFTMRKYGLTVDNLMAATLVSADGELKHVTAETDEELLWGLRGGGGNFGVVTSFEYRAHALGPMVTGGPVFWPIEDAPEVLRHLRDFADEAPDDLGIVLFLRPAPPAAFIPQQYHGKPVMGVFLVWSGDPAEADAATAPIRRLGRPICDLFKVVPYLQLQSMLDGGNPHGVHYYWRSQRVPKLTDTVIDKLVDQTVSSPTPMSYIGGFAIGGAVTRVAPEATSVGKREAGFEINIVAAWHPAHPDPDQQVSWTRRGWEELQPHSSGVYANFLSDETPASVRRSFGGSLPRLTALKRRVDPTNVFSANANISPTP
ncbi:FAD-binding oxidoreductase [Streptomyces sp. NPDC005500]|uniref:FAD-binding oxidoreductase n=1 Tax=Streptomyces sp. NPDC005500 TaxID=3155007 RepID=UPI0033A4F474